MSSFGIGTGPLPPACPRDGECWRVSGLTADRAIKAWQRPHCMDMTPTGGSYGKSTSGGRSSPNPVIRVRGIRHSCCLRGDTGGYCQRYRRLTHCDRGRSAVDRGDAQREDHLSPQRRAQQGDPDQHGHQYGLPTNTGGRGA